MTVPYTGNNLCPVLLLGKTGLTLIPVKPLLSTWDSPLSDEHFLLQDCAAFILSGTLCLIPVSLLFLCAYSMPYSPRFVKHFF